LSRWRPFFVRWLGERSEHLNITEKAVFDVIDRLSANTPAAAEGQNRRRARPSLSTESLPRAADRHLLLPGQFTSGEKGGTLICSDDASGVDRLAVEGSVGNTDGEDIMSVDEEGGAIEDASRVFRVRAVSSNDTESISLSSKPTHYELNLPVTLNCPVDAEMTIERLYTSVLAIMKDLSLSSSAICYQISSGNYHPVVRSGVGILCSNFISSGKIEYSEFARLFLMQLFQWIRSTSSSSSLCPSCCLHSTCFESEDIMQQHMAWCTGIVSQSDKSPAPKRMKTTSASLEASSPLGNTFPTTVSSPFTDLQYGHETRGSRNRLIAEIEHNTALVAAAAAAAGSENPTMEEFSSDSGVEESFVDVDDVETILRHVRHMSFEELMSLAVSTANGVIANLTKRSSSVQSKLPFSKDDVVVADMVPIGFHYPCCECCKQIVSTSDLACSSCPCVYHRRCIDDVGAPTLAFAENGNEIPAVNWWCKLCSEPDGAKYGRLLTSVEKGNSATLMNKWILIYSKSLHRWRKGMIIDRLTSH
jgi:hypothetical protein